MIALGIALVLGLLAGYFANVFLSANQRQAQDAQVGTVKVAVAAIPLDYGVELSAEKVRFVDFPANSVPAGSFQNIQQLLPAGQRRVALRAMVISEPILASKISGPGEGASIAALLPDGMRAASVRINDVSGVAGFVEPNDSVDVLITRTLPGEGNRQVTDVLLQNIRVIAMDQDAKGKDGQPAIARVATLELTPVDTQKVALAQNVGQLSLVLRKPGEEENNPVLQTVSMNDLRYGRASGAAYRSGTTSTPVVRRATTPRRTVRAAPVIRPTTRNVDVVRGTQSNNYEVGQYGS